MMDDTVLSLKTQLLEKEKEIAALKKKLLKKQLEEVCIILLTRCKYFGDLFKKLVPLCVFL